MNTFMTFANFALIICTGIGGILQAIMSGKDFAEAKKEYKEEREKEANAESEKEEV